MVTRRDISKPNLVQRQSQLKAYNILAIPSLLYGCEIRTLERMTKTAEWKFMRHIEGYSLLDQRQNEDNLEETVDQVEKKLAQYKYKWLSHVSRMKDTRYAKQLLDYRPIERRTGRPFKRLQYGYNREAETGHLLT
jgi:hypothetical protein